MSRDLARAFQLLQEAPMRRRFVKIGRARLPPRKLFRLRSPIQAGEQIYSFNAYAAGQLDLTNVELTLAAISRKRVTKVLVAAEPRQARLLVWTAPLATGVMTAIEDGMIVLEFDNRSDVPVGIEVCADMKRNPLPRPC